MGLSIQFLISRKIKARPFANKKIFQEISPGEMSVNYATQEVIKHGVN